MSLPLAGVTVVALEQAVSAPLCTRHLGDLGARVIKIENPSGGDFTRYYDDVVQGMAAHFVWLNRNKESLAIDLKSEKGRAALERLLEKTDVVIQNLAPGAAKRMSLDAESLVTRFPKMIAVDLSGYGREGPYKDQRAYDLLVQAAGGACAITGFPGAPAKAGPPIADVGSGVYALSGILAALYERERTGKGTVINVAMFDVITEWIGFALQYTMHTGKERPGNGMSSPTVAPYGAYRTKDDQTVVLGTTNDSEWQRLSRDLIGRIDLADDARYRTNQLRCEHRAILDAAIEEWTSQRLLVDIQERATELGIGNARYNTEREVLEHEQLKARNRWRSVESEVGPLPVLLMPIDAAQWDDRLDPIPAVGEHGESILSELGYSAGEIEEMKHEKVIVHDA